MAQYPVESDEQLFQAVNYLLSGPGGLGQDFQGFSSSSTGYLTGNFRLPFGQTTTANLYVAPIGLSNAEQLDDRTIKYTFSSAQPSPPFSLGNGINVNGITPSTYNSSNLSSAGFSIFQIGVVECTTTYVIVRTVNPITAPLGTYVSGGTADYRTTENVVKSFYASTDCNARVTVTGATDRVVLSGQINQTISYEVLSGPADLSVWVTLRRYRGFPNNNPVNPDFVFEIDNPGGTVARKIYNFTGLSGTGTLAPLETIFTSIIDGPTPLNDVTNSNYKGPWPAYYWYILEVLFEYPTGGQDIQVTVDELGLRSLSAQVVKQ